MGLSASSSKRFASEWSNQRQKMKSNTYYILERRAKLFQKQYQNMMDINPFDETKRILSQMISGEKIKIDEAIIRFIGLINKFEEQQYKHLFLLICYFLLSILFKPSDVKYTFAEMRPSICDRSLLVDYLQESFLPKYCFFQSNEFKFYTNNQEKIKNKLIEFIKVPYLAQIIAEYCEFKYCSFFYDIYLLFNTFNPEELRFHNNMSSIITVFLCITNNEYTKNIVYQIIKLYLNMAIDCDLKNEYDILQLDNVVTFLRRRMCLHGFFQYPQLFKHLVCNEIQCNTFEQQKQFFFILFTHKINIYGGNQSGNISLKKCHYVPFFECYSNYHDKQNLELNLRTQYLKKEIVIKNIEFIFFQIFQEYDLIQNTYIKKWITEQWRFYIQHLGEAKRYDILNNQIFMMMDEKIKALNVKLN